MRYTATPTPVRLAAFSDDGGFVATLQVDTVVVYNLATSRRVRTLAIDPWITALDLHDDRWLAVGFPDGSVHLWDLRTGGHAWGVRVSAAPVTAVALMAGSEPAAWADADGALGWAGPAGVGVTVAGHSGRVASLRFAPGSGWLVSAGEDGAARVWDADRLVLRHEVREATEYATDAAVDPAGRLLVVTWRNAWRLVRLPHEEVFTSPTDFHYGGSVAVSTDGRYVARGGATVTEVRRSDDGGRALERNTTPAKAVHLGDGLVLSVVDDGALHRSRVAAEGTRLATVVRSLAFCGARERLVAVAGETLRVWDGPGLKDAPWTVSFEARVSAMACGGTDELLVAVGRATREAPGRIERLDAARRLIEPVTTTPGTMTALAVSPDGGMLALGPQQRGDIELRTRDGDPVGRVSTTDPVRRLAFSPDGAVLAAISGGWVRAWRVPSLDLLGEWSPKDRQDYLSFVSPRLPPVHGEVRQVMPGVPLAALRGVTNGDLLAWPVRARVDLRVLGTAASLVELHSGALITDAAITADGRTVAAADEIGRVWVWRAGLEAPVPTAVGVADGDWAGALTGVRPDAQGPEMRVHPNPTNASTTVVLRLAARSLATVTVFGSTGQRVRRLARGLHEAGVHRLTWDGRDDRGRATASGIYVVRAETERGHATVRVVLLR